MHITGEPRIILGWDELLSASLPGGHLSALVFVLYGTQWLVLAPGRLVL